MTLSVFQSHYFAPMPGKEIKYGPYREQAAAFLRRRKSLKLSQTTVAELYGGQQGYISDIERGWVNFAGSDAEWYRRMGHALRCTPEELMNALGVRYIIDGKYEGSEGPKVLHDSAPVGYVAIIIQYKNSGLDGGSVQETTAYLDHEIANLPGLSGLYLAQSFIAAAAVGSIAIYADVPAEIDDVVVFEHQGEVHVAYAAAGNAVTTDTPINPRTPAEFKPERILGVVQRFQQPDRPRRPRMLS